MKKKILIILLSLVAALCLAFGLVACSDKESGSTDNTEQTSPGDDGNTDDEQGGSSGGNTGSTETPDDDVKEDQTIAVTSVSLNVTSLSLEVGESATLTATVLPSNATDKSVTWATSSSSVATVSGGTVKAVGAGTATITVKTSNGKTATCTVTVSINACAITSVEGATIDGTDIFMFVDRNTDSVALLNKVTVSSGSWELYSDILGQNLISTKIAAGSDGVLADGENTFYILLKDDSGESVAVYTLTVYRSYAVKVSYYNHENTLIATRVAYTGYEYETDYTYSADGYTFNGWLEGGESYQTRVLWSNLSLYADMTAKSYTITLNANGGTVSTGTQAVTYDEQFAFLVPERVGYTFLGWYAGETQLTDENGQSLSVWKYADDIEVTAKWEINEELELFIFTSTADTLTITGVKDNSVTDIIVPDYVTEIAQGAFSGCSSLTSITLPFVGGSANAAEASSLTLFGYIFGTSSYTGGTEITQSYASSSYVTYYIPSSLKSVTITGGNILYGAFYNCSNLTSITMTNRVTSIGNRAFRSCTSLTSITIPDSVTSIGSYAFSGCTSLTSVTIGSGVTSIDSYAFSGCTSLEGVYITDITALVNISFGNVTANPLYYAGNLYLNGELVTELVIPDGVTTIGSYAFYGYSLLTSITIPESVTSIGTYAFYNCTALTVINYNAISCDDLSRDNFVFAYAGQDGDGIIVTIGANVEKIPAYLFYPCYRYSSYSPNIVSVVFEKNSNCKSIGGWAFCYVSITSIAIPDGVTVINAAAFSDCTELSSVIIPDSVLSIGGDAFGGCTSLVEVTIGNSVTTIEAGAFSGCTSLTSVVIPKSVTEIGNSGFGNCTSIEVVYYGGTEEEWNSIEIGDFNNDYLKNATIYYYSESEPIEEGNYWHYAEDGVTIVIWGADED